MNRKSKIIAVLLVLVLGVVFVISVIYTHSRKPKQLVALRMVANQPLTNTRQTFHIINAGQSPIMCPDSWYLEFKDGTIQNLSFAPTGDVRVAAGSTGLVFILKPTATPWRLGTFYYEEDFVLEAKVRLGQSGLHPMLPSSATTVQGFRALSEWVE